MLDQAVRFHCNENGVVLAEHCRVGSRRRPQRLQGSLESSAVPPDPVARDQSKSSTRPGSVKTLGCRGQLHVSVG